MSPFVEEGWIWSTEDENLILIAIRGLGVRFEILYLKENLALSPKLLAAHKKSLCILNADENEAETASEERRLLGLFEALMTQVAADVSLPEPYLFHYLYPRRILLEAKAMTPESTTIQPVSKGPLPRQTIRPPGQYLRASARDDWLRGIKCFTSREITLVPASLHPEGDPCLEGPSKVIADGAVCYFKSQFRRVELGRPWVYEQIAAAFKEERLRADMHICRLHGVVVDEDSDVLQHYNYASEEELAQWDDYFRSESMSTSQRMVGVLIAYIENKGTLNEVAPKCLDPKQRLRWAAELEGLIDELHAADLVWGDAKPHNVLVDYGLLISTAVIPPAGSMRSITKPELGTCRVSAGSRSG